MRSRVEVHTQLVLCMPKKRGLGEGQGPLSAFLGIARRAKRAASPDYAEEEEQQLQAALTASLEEVVHVACPLCNVAFAAEMIESHASRCVGLASITEKVQDGNANEGDVNITKKDALVPVREASLFDSHNATTNKRATKHTPGEKNAQDALDRKQSSKKSTFVKKPPRKVPFYKVLEGMPLAVDAFNYGQIGGCKGYFLTHFHSDHYGGLSSRWEHGPIYCSASTARLVCKRLGVDTKWVHTLPMDAPFLIPDSGGVQVTCIDANHCPGACIMLFEGHLTAHILPHVYKNQHIGSAQRFRYLHCGDFRACPHHVRHSAVQGGIDLIYLDTTYLQASHCFPAQPHVIDACVGKVQSFYSLCAPQPAAPLLSWLGRGPARSSTKEEMLVLVGTYSIGKEKLVKALARTLDTMIFCTNARQYDTYAQLDDAELQRLLTRDPLQARVHVTSLFSISYAGLQAWTKSLQDRGMAIARTVGFRPTGWSYRSGRSNADPTMPVAKLLAEALPSTITPESLAPTRDSTDAIQLFSVPYSEHSSFYELMAFCLSVSHKRIIPTVNVGSEASRNGMRRWLSAWTEAQKKKPLVYPRSPLYW